MNSTDDTLDKIDEAIKKYQQTEEIVEEKVKEDTDTKIFDGNYNINEDLEKTIEFDNNIIKENINDDYSKKSDNSETIMLVLYVIALVITVLLVSMFILVLY